MISIIIPALNEENFLPQLLKSIKKQSFKDYEVILADAGSKDKTLQIARKYGCKIVPGGLPGAGRNSGAKEANGDLLFFMDADTFLPIGNSLKEALNEFAARDLDMASFCLHPFPEIKATYFFMDFFYNKMITALEDSFPHAACGILIKKDFFKKLNGFDETIKMGEDFDMARRAAKVGNVGIIKSVEIFVSDRRWRREGWVAMSVKWVLCELHSLFIGPIRSNVFNYKFNHYKESKCKKGDG
jgi:glycosyltransferase involved in cell wall biosynthesis